MVWWSDFFRKRLSFSGSSRLSIIDVLWCWLVDGWLIRYRDCFMGDRLSFYTCATDPYRRGLEPEKFTLQNLLLSIILLFPSPYSSAAVVVLMYELGFLRDNLFAGFPDLRVLLIGLTLLIVARASGCIGNSDCDLVAFFRFDFFTWKGSNVHFDEEWLLNLGNDRESSRSCSFN